MAKFHGDRPRDLGDYALKKKKHHEHFISPPVTPYGRPNYQFVRRGSQIHNGGTNSKVTGSESKVRLELVKRKIELFPLTRPIGFLAEPWWKTWHFKLLRILLFQR